MSLPRVGLVLKQVRTQEGRDSCEGVSVSVDRVVLAGGVSVSARVCL